jgi:hypothetical protein
MAKIFKTTKAKRMQNIVKRAMGMAGNNNTINNDYFTDYQEKKSEALNTLFHELEGVCGDRQAQQIIDTVRKADKGETITDVLPLCALGETLQFVRNEVKKSLKTVKQSRMQGNVVALDAERAKQRMDQMMPVYWMVMHAFYAHYKNFMNAM